MKIVQIIIGQLPEHLKYCVESIMRYSDRHNILYEQVFKLPDCYIIPNDYKLLCETIDRYKIDIWCTEPQTLVVDWDIFIYSDFDFDWGNDIVFFNHPPECMGYNGNNLELFQKIKSNLGNIEIKKFPPQLMTQIIKMEMNQGCNFKTFDKNKVKHWNNFQTIN